MAAKSAAAWAGLRADLLRRVLVWLPCLAHRAAFAAVCFNWRSVTMESKPLRKYYPWLLLPSAGEQGPSVLCFICWSAHRVVLPDEFRGARFCGSFPGGWLVLALQQFRGYALHNLHTGQRIDLPDGLDAPGAANNPLLIMHAAVSARGDLCLAATVALSACSIAFWRPGMDRWSSPTPEEQRGPGSWSPMVPMDTISDVRYYIGHGLEGFHVLTDTEQLLVYVPEHGLDRVGLRTRLVTYHFRDHQVTSLPLLGEGAITRRYLVVYLGELLMVVRAVAPEGNTVAFSVFRLTGVVQNDIHNRDASWFEIQAPNAPVFLGRCSSMVYHIYGIRRLHGFFFLDDATSNHDVDRALGQLESTRQYPCRDMGCLPPRSLQVYQIFPQRPPSEYSRAEWFFH